MRIRQRPQEHGVDHAEDGGVGADAEGERDDGDNAEGGRLDQHPDGVTEIGQHKLIIGLWLASDCVRT